MMEWTRERWTGRKVTIAGLGTFGGQVAAARFFAELGARVTVTDKKQKEALEASLDELDGLGARLVLGGHDEADFAEADLVVASPAIPESSPYLAAAQKAGVPITHEMDIFFQLCGAAIIGITGSNGKSTTAALLAQILSRAPGQKRQVLFGGNIGRSLLGEVRRISTEDLVVLELSSFQLEDLGEAGVSPHGAVVTNISPNHLDRHGTFESYAAAKRNITAHQRKGDFLVLNSDDAGLAGWEQTEASVSYFGRHENRKGNGVYFCGRTLVCIAGSREERAEVPAGWKLRGTHNIANLAAACAAAHEAGVKLCDAAAGAGDFEPLPHRLEYAGTVKGVSFYNDSIATTPESAEAALESLTEPIVLIAGGYDKRVDLAGFAGRAAGRIKALVAIGQTGDKIAAAARARRPDLPVARPADFREAVLEAFRMAAPGEVVLLSPACASFDMFNNFEERGALFKQFARELGPETEAGGQ